MINERSCRLILPFLVGVLFWSLNAGAETLVIGRDSDNPSKHYRQLKPILDYVVNKLKDVGITQGSVLLAKDKEEMVRLLKEGKVDWVTKGVFQALLYSQKAGAEILLRRWRGGDPIYHTIFIARKDSGIQSLNDLKGKKIAFEDPGSTSAYFVPMAVLKRAGFQTVEISSPRENPPDGKVGYAFAGGELNISVWVHKGLTHAGAYHNQDWDDPRNNPPAVKKDLTIFYRSKPLPRMIEVVRKGLDPRIKRRLRDILLKAHEDPAAQEALKSYEDTTRFDEFLGEAKEGLEEGRRMFRYIGEDIR